jgi:peptidyl-Asp metalloendopeptidase
MLHLTMWKNDGGNSKLCTNGGTMKMIWGWTLQACAALGLLTSTATDAASAAWLTHTNSVQKGVVASTALMPVNVDTHALFSQATGETQTIEVNGRRTLKLTALRVLDGHDGARTWVGMHRDGDSEHNVFVTEYRGAVYGTFYASDTVYDLIGDTQKGNTMLRDQKATGFTLAPPVANDFVDPPLPLLNALTQTQKSSASGEVITYASPVPQSVIDLLIVYTEGMVVRFSSVSGVLARLNNLVAQSNTAYLNSDVAITLRLVATLRTSYSETTSDGVAVDEITPSIPAFNRVVTTPAALQGVASLRDSSQADLVMLVRPYRRNAHAACGVAYRNGTVGFDIALYEGWAYGVFSEGLDLEAGNGTCPDTAFSHEMGHIMGLNHDRGSLAVDAPNAAEPTVSYGFGFGYGYSAVGCIVGITCHWPTHGDIMSIAYVNRLLPCYSHPGMRISPDGQSCGLNLSVGIVAGVLPDTPDEACASTAAGCGAANASCNTNTTCAHSARGLNYVRVKVSRWRDAAVTGTVLQGATPVTTFSLCTSSPDILCTTSNNTYRCSGPAGWTGSIHPRAAGYRIPAVVVSSGFATTQTSNLNAQLDSSFPNCNLDVDGNGILDAATDGAAMLRRYLGLGSGAFGGLAGVCAQNTTSASLYAASALSTSAVTGGTPALTSDGLVTLRAMLGLTGTAVTSGAVAPTAPRREWNTPAGASNNIREWLNATCGTAFAP